MIRISIKNFSCISEAEIELGRLTIIIGPQASGKSVISKLVYFCNSIMFRHYYSVEDGEELSDFKDSIRQDFLKWFPPEAWGKEKFNIAFRAGEFSVRIARTFSKTTKREERIGKLTVSLSEFFEEQYRSFLRDWKDAREKLKEKSDNSSASPSSEFERFWRLRENQEKNIRRLLGESYTDYQLFIPAGRSFFTSLGKAVAAFEHVGILDPLTTTFGKLFASYREWGHRRPTLRNKSSNVSSKELVQEFFGGSIHFEKNNEYVLSSDGRKVPFSLLSSGQQELLPLWLVLEALSWRSSGRDLYFIEEPEAHLFPSTQAHLTCYLATLVSGSGGGGRVFTTTHSPYVLATINNLLKAGSLAARLPAAAQQAISKTVPRVSWLKPGDVRAFAIKEGKAYSILDDTELIDVEYLDDVSSSISSTFSDLLDIEYREWK
jgi:AAA15 family ATPase/GTPase